MMRTTSEAETHGSASQWPCVSTKKKEKKMKDLTVVSEEMISLQKGLIEKWIEFHDNMMLISNKAAQRRARAASLQLRKMLKEFRALNIKEIEHHDLSND